MASYQEINYKLCVLCQSPKENGPIVNKPKHTSYENLLSFLCKLYETSGDILNDNEVSLTHLSLDDLIITALYGIEIATQHQQSKIAWREKIKLNHHEDANERYLIILCQQLLHHHLHILDHVQIHMINRNVSFVKLTQRKPPL